MLLQRWKRAADLDYDCSSYLTGLTPGDHITIGVNEFFLILDFTSEFLEFCALYKSADRQ